MLIDFDVIDVVREQEFDCLHGVVLCECEECWGVVAQLNCYAAHSELDRDTELYLAKLEQEWLSEVGR